MAKSATASSRPRRPRRATSGAAKRGPARTFDALPDTMDFRDKIYTPTLIEVPSVLPLDAYLAAQVPILDQGREGACTGFGLATVAHYLLRVRKRVPDPRNVSARMFYEMAKRYDEWPGENYSGSSARGAMKGWHKHGVCTEEKWPYTSDPAADPTFRQLTHERAAGGCDRPLGAYYRVNHKDLVAMHSAIAETGVLYATALVHEGWNSVGADGVVRYRPGSIGGHAFAIVAYDNEGFWVQNSWGDDWGKRGFCRVSYDDWLLNGSDVWVARLGAPVSLHMPAAQAVGKSAAAAQSATYSFNDLRPHIISIGNDGRLRAGGTFGTSKEDVRHIFTEDFRRITAGWKHKRILLYAHGGLTGEDSAVQRLADLRAGMLAAEVYPVAFIWKTDFWSTVTNILNDAMRRRRPEGLLDKAKDFMLDRLDDALEPVARVLGGRLLWDEMKENAVSSTDSAEGGARFVLEQLVELEARVNAEQKTAKNPPFEIHMVGHSAGSIFLGPMLQRLTGRGHAGLGRTVATCTLWAPAATVALFKERYAGAIKSGALERFCMFLLDDRTERDDHCADIYHKSLLYLVSNAFENQQRIPIFRDGVPVIGMEKFVRADRELTDLFKRANAEYVLTPNTARDGLPGASRAAHHGSFDDDAATLRATLARILDARSNKSAFVFQPSASSAARMRRRLG